ncbi:prenyltransferase/squalene oxidase repeat-containing protein [Schlesneria paludicola]|uniref:prenyltransferase/squalene oxidase repeat-containing protein n=1 Tax=Schlesneria paludicola TaxID=360056 RepID=UPI00029A67C0|nr:prenyltransferase/squalene oxidase repeat-containing protein [Schlesneria paludicola]
MSTNPLDHLSSSSVTAIPQMRRGRTSLFARCRQSIWSLAQLINRWTRKWNRKRFPVVALVSVLLHVLVLGICGLIVIRNPQLVDEIFTTLVEPTEVGEPLAEHSLFPLTELDVEVHHELMTADMAANQTFETLGPMTFNVSDAFPQVAVNSTDAPKPIEMKIGDATAGRMSAVAKRTMLEKFGGNSASEAAVALGLKWLVNHQLKNGSWSFEHSAHPNCKGQCTQDGSLRACPTGATGLALLAFLGAGHTQHSGDYQKEVQRGFDYLLKVGKQSSGTFDLRGNVVSREGMYVQGLCTIALCESAAMSHDSRIRKAAQGAIEFIVKSQNTNDGGWRYYPGQAGDTSVVGWQVMALKSGHDAKLDFSKKVFNGSEKFLDLVQSNRGAQYAYMPGTGPRDSMTAVGLLCRMYLGWDRTNPRLANGVAYLDSLKPSSQDMYFNYYATQVMHHWGGDEWTRWNDVMRDQLVTTQHHVRTGHRAGSWDVADTHGAAGGRHYMTCLAIMTLEVYYRHLPLYNRDTLKIEF